PQVVSAIKLPILNPNEFDLWKMRIEQYFLMLDYSLWEDAKTLMEAIEKRFGGNTDTKKVQKTLLKQQYENFTGSSSESLDQIHDRLQKLISQLEILGVSLTQEDINLKFLRSLPIKWMIHNLI
nr:ribonuclease H-like domain-containing protein [Tanacetum cinerariifolium]